MDASTVLAADAADETSEWTKVILSLTGGATGLAIIAFLMRKLWAALTSGLEADYARMKKERDDLQHKYDKKEEECDDALTQRDEWHQKYDNLYWDFQRLKLQHELHKPHQPRPKELTTNAEDEHTG